MDHTLVVEIFKTDVLEKSTAGLLLQELHIQFPDIKFNFDLDDCDKILRAEGDPKDTAKITEVLNSKGFDCEVLE